MKPDAANTQEQMAKAYRQSKELEHGRRGLNQIVTDAVQSQDNASVPCESNNQNLSVDVVQIPCTQAASPQTHLAPRSEPEPSHSSAGMASQVR